MRYACPYDPCKKTYSRKDHLKRHVDYAHLGETFLCEYTGCRNICGRRDNVATNVQICPSSKVWSRISPVNILSAKRNSLRMRVDSSHLGPMDSILERGESGENAASDLLHIDLESSTRCHRRYQIGISDFKEFYGKTCRDSFQEVFVAWGSWPFDVHCLRQWLDKKKPPTTSRKTTRSVCSTKSLEPI